MAINRWDPFKDLLNLQEKMNRLFEESLIPRREMIYGGSWIPPVDIYETEEEITAIAELPGMKSEDITVEVKENILVIKGEKKPEAGLESEKYHHLERNNGKFYRVFSLPSRVDEDKVKAGYFRGVLEIKMPKSSAPKGKKVKVD